MLLKRSNHNNQPAYSHHFYLDLSYPHPHPLTPGCLQSNISVERLDLSDNGVDEDAAVHLGRMLLHNERITDLVSVNVCRWVGQISM